MPEKIKIGLVYFLMAAGGLWHILDLFQTTMRVIAGPLLIILSLLLIFECWQHARIKRNYLIWVTVVIAGGFFAEWIGVNTGILFGSYTYGTTLQPQLSGVPVAIGFAWLTSASGAIAWSRKITGHREKLWIPSLLAALLMVIFDVIMEPAAVFLNYWTWQGGHVPVNNYLTWFVLGFLFIILGYRLRATQLVWPGLARHLFLAQILYFALVILKQILQS
ncbi:carotenoid biosynthesis protein [candidate division KSB1 bacterium]|nr:carotenoid biosynthesis protein [candidate division KSB1 bacterium]